MKNLLLMVVMVLCVTAANASDVSEDVYIGTISEKTSFDITNEMDLGWNLGNTLDVPDLSEELWGNPKTTKAMIDGVRAKGFKTLRVPVTWGPHIGDGPDFKIDEKWMQRVEEVVVWGLQNDMYVIMNVHHDDEWMVPSYAKLDEATQKLEKVWLQIAQNFEKYNERLIFETMNEPRLKGSPQEWNGGDAEGRDCVNKLHAAAIKKIRSTGGNNATRQVMISPYAAATVAAEGLVLPDDDNLIVSIHLYHSYGFCMQPLNGGGRNYLIEQDMTDLYWELDRLLELFYKKGTPVVIGEWGSMYRDNTQAREEHANMYAKACMKRSIPCVVWDNGQNKNDEFGLYNRNNCTWWYEGIVDNILDGVSEKPTVNITPELTSTFTIVPNPATSNISIKGASHSNYQIWSSMGTEVMRGDNYNEESISVASLASGAYYVVIDGIALQFMKK